MNEWLVTIDDSSLIVIHQILRIVRNAQTFLQCWKLERSSDTLIELLLLGMRFEATKHDSDDRRSDMMRRKLLESTVTTIRVTQNFETIVLVGILLEINKKKKDY